MTGLKRRRITKEGFLLGLGVAIILFEVINAEVLGHPLHSEFLILAGSLCGLAGTLRGDKK